MSENHDTKGNQSGNPHDDEDDAGGPRRGALVALIVVVVLVAGGIWLSQRLRSVGTVQDCVMAGRNNCAPIQK